MATMLSFLVTDAAVARAASCSASCARRRTTRFNRVTVDGETSTSDTVLLLANGAAGNRRLTGPASPGAAAFRRAVHEVCERPGPGPGPGRRGRHEARHRARGRGAQRRAGRDGGPPHRELDAGQDGDLRRRPELGAHPADGRRGPTGPAAGSHDGQPVRRAGVPEGGVRGPGRASPGGHPARAGRDRDRGRPWARAAAPPASGPATSATTTSGSTPTTRPERRRGSGGGLAARPRRNSLGVPVGPEPIDVLTNGQLTRSGPPLRCPASIGRVTLPIAGHARALARASRV